MEENIEEASGSQDRDKMAQGRGGRTGILHGLNVLARHVWNFFFYLFLFCKKWRHDNELQLAPALVFCLH